MHKFLSYVMALLTLPALAIAAEPVNLSADTYKPDLGVLIIQVNWGAYLEMRSIRERAASSTYIYEVAD